MVLVPLEKSVSGRHGGGVCVLGHFRRTRGSSHGGLGGGVLRVSPVGIMCLGPYVRLMDLGHYAHYNLWALWALDCLGLHIQRRVLSFWIGNFHFGVSCEVEGLGRITYLLIALIL